MYIFLRNIIYIYLDLRNICQIYICKRLRSILLASAVEAKLRSLDNLFPFQFRYHGTETLTNVILHPRTQYKYFPRIVFCFKSKLEEERNNIRNVALSF